MTANPSRRRRVEWSDPGGLRRQRRSPQIPPDEGFPMRFRPLALFALAAGVTALLGDLGTSDAVAQVEKKAKKRKFDVEPTPTKVDPVAIRPPAPVLPT